MTLEGKIRITLEWDGQAIRNVTLTPRPLLDANRLVRGKRAGEAASLIPLLFSLCGQAQGVAAALALDAAQGRPGVSPEQERRVIVEALQETAWRVLLDLPQLFGLPGDPATLAALRKRCAETPDGEALAAYLEELLEQHLFGIPGRAWSAFSTSAQLEDWLAQANTPLAVILRQLWQGAGNRGNSDIAPLPELSTPQIVTEFLPVLLDDANFASLPRWHGMPAESGALARLGGHPLLEEIRHRQGNTVNVRLLARLLDLARFADRLRGADSLWLRQARVKENAGLAWLQTSRGVLIHYAEVESGLVTDYRIVAPTEWNFHPNGAFVRGLTGQAAASAEEARHSAALLLHALDPCVAYEISVAPA